MLCYVISHVPEILKGFRTKLFCSELIPCALILVRKSTVGIWQGGPAEPSTFPARPRLRPQGFWGGLRSRARHSHIYCASSSEGSKPSCTNQTLLTTMSLQHKP